MGPILLTAVLTTFAGAAGPHPVGFRQQWHFDYGRTYAMRLPDGTEYANGKAPRPILMNLWYPAAATPTAKRMPYSIYHDFAKGHPEIRPWLEAFQKYNREVVGTELTGKAEKDRTAVQREELARFFASPTMCVLDAPVAKGKFPVIFYHAGYGSSVDDNSEFCEAMASRGYVVVGSGYQAGDGKGFNIDALAGSIGDIRFLTSYLRTQRFVDWQHIGMVGHSGGAHTALKYRAVPGGAVDAIVSLDTTEDYYSLKDPRWTFIGHVILPNLENMTGPILMVANPHAFFELADKFTGAERAYFTVRLDHNEFISQGVQRLRLAERLAAPAGRVKATQERTRVEESYRRLCAFIGAYFDAKLKGDGAVLSALAAVYEKTPVGGALPHLDRSFPAVEYSEGVPTPRQIRPLLAKAGVGRVVELLKAGYRKEEPAPVYEPTFAYALAYELFKTDRREDAVALCRAYKELGVPVAKMFYNQAWLGDLTKNYPFALECLDYLFALEPEHAEGRKMLGEIREKMKGS